MTQPKSTSELRALDAAHHLHPFSDMKSLNAEGSRIVVKAEGVWLTDSEGNRILDGMSGLWCVNVGYGREEIVEAVAAQLRELPYYNTFFKTTHRPAIELAAKLAELTPPQFNRVFFTGSGSESNDTVIKLVRRFFQIKEKPEKKIIISRRNAYHGSTVGAASLGGMAPMHAQGGLQKQLGRVVGQRLADPFLARHAAGDALDVVSDQESTAHGRHAPSSEIRSPV